MTKNKKIVTVAVVGIAIMAVTYGFLWLWAKADLGNLPPENYTSTTMYPLKTRILRYAKNHNSLPPNLTVLPPLEGFINSTKDVWGNEIIYQVRGTTIKLISYGKDQKPGGVGKNLDVIGIFEAKSGFGGWAGEDDNNWTVKPLANISTSKAEHNQEDAPGRKAAR
jgi:hypothetical protein